MWDSFLEQRDDVDVVVRAVGDVDAPVVDVERDLVAPAAGEEAERERKGEHERDGNSFLFQFFIPFQTFMRFFWRLSSRAWMTFMPIITARMRKNMSVNME